MLLKVFIVIAMIALVAAPVVGCGGEQGPAGPEGPSETQEPPETQGPETVSFPDENLEAAIRDALGKTADEEITTSELATLIILSAESSDITTSPVWNTAPA